MIGLIRESKVADVLGEMHERVRKEAYVRKTAQPGYRLAIDDFERLLAVKGRRRGLRQVQKGGNNSVQIQASEDYRSS